MDVVQQKTEQLRAIRACPKHLRISEGLKQYKHVSAKYSDNALYWAEECDDCAVQIVTREWTITL